MAEQKSSLPHNPTQEKESERVGEKVSEKDLSQKKNCWEVMGCGREPDGERVYELGVCPVAIWHVRDGQNGGVNAGRICWTVAGTFCRDEIQASFVEKQLTCLECKFLKQVIKEEGDDFTPL
jgi:hypothetical protein